MEEKEEEGEGHYQAEHVRDVRYFAGCTAGTCRIHALGLDGADGKVLED